MNPIRTTLLITTCISLSLHSMENDELKTSLLKSSRTNLTTMQINDIQQLYHNTYEKFEEITPYNNEAASRLLKIIEHANHLKNNGLDENYLINFAFKQEVPLRDNLLYHVHSLYNGPHYMSVFFARLKAYNEILKTNNFTTPTIEQYTTYKNNQRINTAITKAASFKVYIDAEPLKKNDLLKEIPDSIAVQKFHELINDIYTIRCENPTTITEIATLLYNNINTNL